MRVVMLSSSASHHPSPRGRWLPLARAAAAHFEKRSLAGGMRGVMSRNSKILASAPSNNCSSNPRSFHIATRSLSTHLFPNLPHRQALPVNTVKQCFSAPNPKIAHASRPLSWGRHGGRGLCGLCAARAWPLCLRGLCGLRGGRGRGLCRVARCGGLTSAPGGSWPCPRPSSGGSRCTTRWRGRTRPGRPRGTCTSRDRSTWWPQ